MSFTVSLVWSDIRGECIAMALVLGVKWDMMGMHSERRYKRG